jgi:hypothetical protein
MDTIDHTIKINIEYLTPVFNGMAPGPIGRVTANPSVVAQGIHTTKSAVSPIGQRLDRIVSRHVSRHHGKNTQTGSLELARRSAQALTLGIRQNDCVPADPEHLRQCTPYSTCRTGDGRHLPLPFIH